MNPAMSLPEVRWFVRGPKVAIFEMKDVDIDVSHLGPPPAPASHRRLKADATEEIDEGDILAEFPADLTPDGTARLPAIVPAPGATVRLPAFALTYGEDDATRPAIHAFKRRSGWLVAITAGALFGLVLAAGISLYARQPIAPSARPQTKAAAAKSLIPSVAALGAVVPTVNVYNLPHARGR